MIDPRAFRQTVGQFATGVTIITTEVEGAIRALTVNSFTAVSLEPPLVLFCVGKKTKTGQAIDAVKSFTVNILRQEQQDLSTYFAGGWKDALPPRFEWVEWHGGRRLDGCAAAVGCSTYAVHEGGDHWIVLGQVMALHVTSCTTPLIFHGSRYANLGATFERDILVSGF